MQKLLNRTFFILAHPMLMPTYALLILLYSNYPYTRYIQPDVKIHLLQFFFLSTAIFPFISLLVMYWRKQIGSLWHFTQKERRIPYLSGFIFNMVLLVLFQRIRSLPPEINLIPILAGSLNLIAMLVNLKFNISIYTLMLGFLTGFSFAVGVSYSLNFLWLIISLILVSGILSCLRLRLDYHKPGEIYIGYILGFVLTVVLCILFK